MDKDDYLDGIYAIIDGHNSRQALEIMGKNLLTEYGNKILTADVMSEISQRRHIMEKMRFDGMKAMLDYMLKELDFQNKKRNE